MMAYWVQLSLILLFSASGLEFNDYNKKIILNYFPSDGLSNFKSPISSWLPSYEQDNGVVGCGKPPTKCHKSKYRTMDGSCNNLLYPGLGLPNTPFKRFLPSNYGDGINSPTLSKSRKPLVSARTLRLAIYTEVPKVDKKFTLSAMQFGQYLSHDMSLVAPPTTQTTTKCCTEDGSCISNPKDMNGRCFPVLLSFSDIAYKKQGMKCMSVPRSDTDKSRRCLRTHKPVEQVSQINHYLDLSQVYGNDEATMRQLREFKGGRLRSEVRDNREWLPRHPNASQVCQSRTQKMHCYIAGDPRVNLNTQLTLVHVIFLREHNRLARALSKINPHWNDETLFQEARRILNAQYLQITYYEWLPIFLGWENSLRRKLIYKTRGYIEDYSPYVDPRISNEFATAAFRYFHSLVAGFSNLVGEDRKTYDRIRMSDYMNQATVLELGKNFDGLTRGLTTQPQMEADMYHDNEITLYLEKNLTRNAQFGNDLKAIDIQRNRDHGFAPYNEYRRLCGLPRAKTFSDFGDVISADMIQQLKTFYEHPDDVELTVAGTMETHVPGTLAGPTFLCLLTDQFYRSRVGDRFWFESGTPGIKFTLNQLNEIRKSTFGKLLCNNGDNIKLMQPRVFELLSRNNTLVPCESLPSINLLYWKEEPLKKIT